MERITCIRFGLAICLFVLEISVGDCQTNKLDSPTIIKLDCTLYYTPKESGFVPGKGFDLHPVSKHGLRGRKFATDFLRAVQMEGHGLLAHMQGRYSYIYYCNGSWGYTDLPRGIKQTALIPLQSCAVSFETFRSRHGEWFKVQQNQLPSKLEAAIWQVVDVGGNVNRQQIDLYWGEDNPRGSGSKIYLPAGTSFTGLSRAQFKVVRKM